MSDVVDTTSTDFNDLLNSLNTINLDNNNNIISNIMDYLRTNNLNHEKRINFNDHYIIIKKNNNDEIEIFVGDGINRLLYMFINNINESFYGIIGNKPGTNTFEYLSIDQLINQINNRIRINNYNFNYLFVNSLEDNDLNNNYIEQSLELCEKVLCAWGREGIKPNILDTINPNNLYQYTKTLDKRRPKSLGRKSNNQINSILINMIENNDNSCVVKIQNINLIR